MLLESSPAVGDGNKGPHHLPVAGQKGVIGTELLCHQPRDSPFLFS